MDLLGGGGFITLLCRRSTWKPSKRVNYCRQFCPLWRFSRWSCFNCSSQAGLQDTRRKDEARGEGFATTFFEVSAGKLKSHVWAFPAKHLLQPPFSTQHHPSCPVPPGVVLPKGMMLQLPHEDTGSCGSKPRTAGELRIRTGSRAQKRKEQTLMSRQTPMGRSAITARQFPPPCLMHLAQLGPHSVLPRPPPPAHPPPAQPSPPGPR